jgi:tetratricopeptide (TPR) repeat protein
MIFPKCKEAEMSMKSLATIRKLNPTNQDHPMLANYLNNIGLNYERLLNYPKALEYLERSLEINLKIFKKKLRIVYSFY